MNCTYLLPEVLRNKCQFEHKKAFDFIKNLQGLQVPQKLSSLKSLNIQVPAPILGFFTPAIIKNGFVIKFQVAKI